MLALILPIVDLEQNRANVCLVAITYNSGATLPSFWRSLHPTLRADDRVVFVDNASTDDSLDILREIAAKDHRVQVIENSQNLGYSKAANQGIRATETDFVALLNPDTVVTPNWIERMLAHFDDGVAAVGPTSDCVAGLQFVRFHLPPEHQPTGPNEIPEVLYRLNKGKSLDVRRVPGLCNNAISGTRSRSRYEFRIDFHRQNTG